MADGQGGQQGGGDGGAMVPSHRLKEETDRAKAAEARVVELEAKLSGFEGERMSWGSERSVYRRGITDPEGVEIAMFLHGKIPEKGRPEIGAWLQGMTAENAPQALRGYLPQPPAQQQQQATQQQAAQTTAQQASSASSAATQAPTSTQAVQQGEAVVTRQATATTTTQATQTANGTTAGAGARSGGYDAAQINAMREEARRTGDYSKLRAALPDIMKSVTAR